MMITLLYGFLTKYLFQDGSDLIKNKKESKYKPSFFLKY